MKSSLKTTLVFCLGVAIGLGFSYSPFKPNRPKLIKAEASYRPLEGQTVKVASVYDGDTFKADIDGLPPIFGKSISIRLRGIDTPEIRGGTAEAKAKARESRDHLAFLLKRGDVTLHNVGRGKFFRVLADVKAGGVDVVAEMLKLGLGKPYYGGTR